MRLILASAFVTAALLIQPASAQEQRGAIEGTVQDIQQAMLPGATIAALNRAQGTTVSTTADTTGTFRFPALAPGYYDVTASLPGFAALQVQARRGPARTGQAARVRARDCRSRRRRSACRPPRRSWTRARARVCSACGRTRSICCPRAAISRRLVKLGAGCQPGAEARGHLHRRLERLGEPVRHQWHRDHEPDQRPIGS